jgi:hypothetical protein
MTEDGDDGEATLHESFTDKQGVHRVRNDFSSGRYKVIADVTEATATRRDKTVKSMLGNRPDRDRGGRSGACPGCRSYRRHESGW